MAAYDPVSGEWDDLSPGTWEALKDEAAGILDDWTVTYNNEYSYNEFDVIEEASNLTPGQIDAIVYSSLIQAIESGVSPADLMDNLAAQREALEAYNAGDPTLGQELWENRDMDLPEELFYYHGD